MHAVVQTAVLASRHDKLDRISQDFPCLDPGQATTCNSLLLTSFMSLQGGLYEAPEEISAVLNWLQCGL